MVFRKDGSVRSAESVGYSGGRFVADASGVLRPQIHVVDHLGSVRAIVDKSGNVVERDSYYPYGERWNDGNVEQADNRYRYNGKESQEGFGLPYLDYGARLYDPATGRWLTQDPLSEKYHGISPYVFCAGNPVKYVDGDSLWVANNAVIAAIKNGLSANNVQLLQFNNGILDPASIPANSSDWFLQDLYDIASSNQMVEMSIEEGYSYRSSDNSIGQIVFENTPIDENTNEFGEGYESLLKEMGEPIGLHIHGNLGRTLVPSPSPWMSTNGNIQIIINSKGSLNHRTVGIAHEFGHVLLYINGMPYKHGDKKVDSFIYGKASLMSKRLGYDF